MRKLALWLCLSLLVCAFTACDLLNLPAGNPFETTAPDTDEDRHTIDPSEWSDAVNGALRGNVTLTVYYENGDTSQIVIDGSNQAFIKTDGTATYQISIDKHLYYVTQKADSQDYIAMPSPFDFLYEETRDIRYLLFDRTVYTYNEQEHRYEYHPGKVEGQGLPSDAMKYGYVYVAFEDDRVTEMTIYTVERQEEIIIRWSHYGETTVVVPEYTVYEQ